MILDEGISVEHLVFTHQVDADEHPFFCVVIWVVADDETGHVTSVGSSTAICWARDANHAENKLRVMNKDMPEKVSVKNIIQMDDPTCAGIARYFFRKLLA